MRNHSFGTTAPVGPHPHDRQDRQDPTVAKAGGSLLREAGGWRRVAEWAATRPGRVVLVPGGGEAADLVRAWQPRLGLGEAAAHWLAIDSLSLTARVWGQLLGWPVVADDEGLTRSVLDPAPLMRLDSGREGCLPESWEATSDAVAARVAELWGAVELAMLKSCGRPEGLGPSGVSESGLADRVWAEVVARAGLRVGWVDLGGRRRPG